MSVRDCIVYVKEALDHDFDIGVRFFPDVLCFCVSEGARGKKVYEASALPLKKRHNWSQARRHTQVKARRSAGKKASKEISFLSLITLKCLTLNNSLTF
jgi:hypothetical protein